MSPIRAGIIGLSSVTGEKTASPGDGWAASAHLPYLIASKHYEVTALCNTSEASAKLAVQRHGLPSTTKTFGSPEALAADPDIDLVVCCVRVDRHYKTIKPALEAGKDVFVEWPLGRNLAEAEELLAIAKKSGSKTIVGLQVRGSAHATKVREMVESGAIGKVLSSTYSLQIGFFGETEPPGIDYIAKKEHGGNLHSIVFAHAADPVFHAFGGLPMELTALLKTQWKQTRLLHADGTFDKMINRETPDHILMQAMMPKHDMPVSITVRGGKMWKDEPVLKWQILGTEGQIQVTSPPTMVLDLGDSTIELYKHDGDFVEIVDVQYDERVKHLGTSMARNIGLLYEQYAGEQGPGFVDFEEAVKFHKLLAAMEKSSDAGGTATKVE